MRNTLVKIRSIEYKGFPVDSIIDCNVVFDRKIDFIISKLKNNQLQIKPDMSQDIVERLRDAAIQSPMVEGWKKDLLTTF